MGYNVVLQYTYTLCDDYIRLINHIHDFPYLSFLGSENILKIHSYSNREVQILISYSHLDVLCTFLP